MESLLWLTGASLVTFRREALTLLRRLLEVLNLAKAI